MREIPLRRLPPLKMEALDCLGREPLRRAADGWSNRWGGPFNSATVSWLASIGACRLTGAEAAMTRDGHHMRDAARLAA